MLLGVHRPDSRGTAVSKTIWGYPIDFPLTLGLYNSPADIHGRP